MAYMGLPLGFLSLILLAASREFVLMAEWLQDVEPPQGSRLGPLLVLISINDLPCSVRANNLMCADETSFISLGNNVGNLYDTVNSAMVEASVWFQTNGFYLNNTKIQNIIFALGPSNVMQCH